MNDDLALETAKQHPLWEAFAEFAEDEGISLESHDDWFDWWNCFVRGAEAASDIE